MIKLGSGSSPSLNGMSNLNRLHEWGDRVKEEGDRKSSGRIFLNGTVLSDHLISTLKYQSSFRFNRLNFAIPPSVSAVE